MRTVALIDGDSRRRNQVALALTTVAGLSVSEFASTECYLHRVKQSLFSLVLIEASLLIENNAEAITEPTLAFSCTMQMQNAAIPLLRLDMNLLPSFATEVQRFMSR
ncbi:hypothetical protein [Aestuariibacter salexigens]|uniref:hypothetical protein n=1 Tax=Aestuariibacter salexigens TaxID=226010 RepID=UPI00047D37A8|nr:hypothetical protein [Aestuariibacter salexigens]